MKAAVLLFVKPGNRHTQRPGQEGNLVIPHRTLAGLDLGNAGLVQGVSGDCDARLQRLLGQASGHAQGTDLETDLVATSPGHPGQGRAGEGPTLCGDPGFCGLGHASFMAPGRHPGYAVAEYSIAT